jgi:ribose transport system permease protein
MTAVRRDVSAVKRMIAKPGVPILLFLILLIVVLSVASDQFLTSGNVFAIANQSVYVLILAVAMTFVLIGGGIDLSVGSVLGLSGGVAAYLLAHGTPMPLAFAAALLAGAVMGAINGLVITKLRVPDFVATLAMLGIARGVLYVWTNAIPFRDYMTTTYYTIGGLNRLFWEVTVPIVVALAATLAGAFALRRTRFGRQVRGAGSNVEAARLSGVAVDRLKIGVYVLSGTLAAVAGILLAGRLTTVHPEMGTGYELDAIAAAVMGGAALTGGRGSILGAFVGAVTLTVIQNAINILNVNPYWETIITGTVILVAVIVARASVAVSRPKQAGLAPSPSTAQAEA